ncbi:hypothetical protein ASC61_04255 [Aeromicrobium sp. Root344]|uniref:hypothetical protein n=1 Tax=Aeromicrobium sp. Root344 TaxID=1736521 RepID=UPI0006FC41E6|nr:hypothetical protein [Aeromicrobium sp. Root344]KQV74277.1 hypothetical protein ASC61_04255 [Aeromicrobium sp. Root344]
MILSPEAFVPVEMSRHHAVAMALTELSRHERDRSGFAPRRARKPRRGLVVRLVSMTVGRTAHV